MAKSKATMRVEEIQDRVNAYLTNSPVGGNDADRAEFRAMRLGACSVLESILHATGNYHGFMYLDGPYVAGVTDESRRHYYTRFRAYDFGREQTPRVVNADA